MRIPNAFKPFLDKFAEGSEFLRHEKRAKQKRLSQRHSGVFHEFEHFPDVPL